MTNWNERFKEIRDKYGYSQSELADILGVDETTVSRYEKGRGAKKLTSNFRLKLKQVFTSDEVEYIEYGDKDMVSQNINGNNNTQAGRDIKYKPVDAQTYKEGKMIGQGTMEFLQMVAEGYPYDDPIMSALIKIMRDFKDEDKTDVLYYAMGKTIKK